jgi:hypothetical protein
MAGEEGIPQGLKPLFSLAMERPKAEALGYLEAEGHILKRCSDRPAYFVCFSGGKCGRASHDSHITESRCGAPGNGAETTGTADPPPSAKDDN